MLYYIIQTMAFQLMFLIVYDVFLKRETFFNWNRLYLLLTPILSLIIPLIKITEFKNIISRDFVIDLPEIFIGEATSPISKTSFDLVTKNESTMFSWEAIFYLGMLVVSMLLFYKLFNIWRILNKNPKVKKETFTIVKLFNSSSAFSFFNYIFLGDKINLEEQDAILLHEAIHVKQKHSLDLIYFEILKIIFWFNPLVYIFQRKTQTLHEYIADAEATKFQNKNQYYQNLLTQVFETNNLSFINSFFKKTLIKKRIVMLQKSKSKQIKLLKYLILLPIVFGMLILTSCMQSGNAQSNNSITTVQDIINTPLIMKINAVRHQIQRQGNISKSEEQGLDLLLAIVKDKEINQDFINKVQTFISSENKSDLEFKIAEVFEQIQKQGNLDLEEEKTLKGLLLLTSENGFNDPFFSDVIEFAEIPFGIIQQVPVFPGCEELETNNAKAKCFSENVAKHVNRNFNTKLADSLGLKGKQQINVIFKISNNGDIIDVRSRAESSILQAEAERVIKTLPKMIPGEMEGKKVNVPYSLPIIFQVAE